MSIGQVLKQRLEANAALAALVGNRIHPVQLPQNATLPAITYTRISRKPTQHRSNPRATHNRQRVQFDIWAGSYDSTEQVRAALFDAMAQIQGGNPRIDVALVQDDRDAFESDPGRWRGIVDYMITHTGD